MAQGLGLTTYPGDSATANNMSEFFTLAPVTASPSSLTFSSRYLNTTSPAQTVTLSNPQTTALSIASIAFTGSNPADFGQTNNCGSSLAAGAARPWRLPTAPETARRP